MIDSESESFSFSLHFNGHFPGGPGLAGTRMSPFWLLLELRMMDVVVITGAITCAKQQSKYQHQQTNTQNFLQAGQRMPFLSPDQQYQSTEGILIPNLNQSREIVYRSTECLVHMIYTYSSMATKQSHSLLITDKYVYTMKGAATLRYLAAYFNHLFGLYTDHSVCMHVLVNLSAIIVNTNHFLYI